RMVKEEPNPIFLEFREMQIGAEEIGEGGGRGGGGGGGGGGSGDRDGGGGCRVDNCKKYGHQRLLRWPAMLVQRKRKRKRKDIVVSFLARVDESYGESPPSLRLKGEVRGLRIRLSPSDRHVGTQGFLSRMLGIYGANLAVKNKMDKTLALALAFPSYSKDVNDSSANGNPIKVCFTRDS
ncbi:hypothetical protein V1477_000343, partial [Vespula maculifrons]